MEVESTFVLFGATGDLAKRKIYPALFNLFLDQKLPGAFSVIGLGRRELSNEVFQNQVRESLKNFSRRAPVDTVTLNVFLSAFQYSVLDVSRKEDYKKLFQHVERREEELSIPQNRMFYLSVGPEFFEIIATNIKESGLGSTQGWKRLIIEKPFGRDLKTARELNDTLSKTFEENEIYRIDHYLGKHMVQNLEVLEYSNPVLEALWSNRYIANVQITASETVGVEERAGYYDKSGALRDMFQNHLLQLLMMTAIQLPKHSTPEEVQSKKRQIMQSLRPLQPEDIIHDVVRGQYTAGEIQGKPVVGYTDELGVDETSTNDTFIAARLWIDDSFWNEVPFYIRTGKRMNEKSTRIVIEFKEPLDQYLNQDKEQSIPNLLVLEIGPNEAVTLHLNSTDPFSDNNTEPVLVNCYSSSKDLPEAYENLIHDAMRGDSTFFAHWDEVEMSWKWVQPILDAVEMNSLPLHGYSAGSFGPEASNILIGEDRWWRVEDNQALIETNERIENNKVPEETIVTSVN
uniref:glucose-6-phosphate dehydrogenase n=1 Tax=Paenibacillus sp. IHBB 10380 TaxID=1566358 RepID=UPI0006991B2E|nr:glucose-6-phosphate dehydrogenase [Paenibacillus sp. IHBB 10380]